jgi:hypothetical protein
LIVCHFSVSMSAGRGGAGAWFCSSSCALVPVGPGVSERIIFTGDIHFVVWAEEKRIFFHYGEEFVLRVGGVGGGESVRTKIFHPFISVLFSFLFSGVISSTSNSI